jgi:Ca2+-binding RTX toxin-like protein
MNPRPTALVTVLTIVAVAAAALLVTPGSIAQVEAAQTVDVKVAGPFLRVKGTNDDDKLTLRLNAGDANVLEVDVGDDGSADFSFDRALFTEIKVNAKNGDDLIRVDEVNGPIVEPASILGGNGNDTILGGSAVETIYGGNGDDFIDGNRAADIAFMGAGDDTFRWDPGDASDVVEGEDGSDTLLFNGANVTETVDLSANGERFTFFRQPGNITMDMNEVEISVFNALNGPDTITVNDLAGTDLTQVDLSLESGPGNGVGDLLVDQVIVNGTPGDDAIVVTGGAGNVNVAGLSATVAISFAEAANDRLDINTLAGSDTVDASALQADAIKQLTVDGGSGNDLILGGRGADVLTGGDGDDFIDGNQAIDVAFMGAGDDAFRWDPGDASDVVEGEDGSDTLLFNGSAGGETVDLSANGERFTFFRQPGNITMDMNEVEISVFNALGGPDTITVNDLTGTDVTQLNLELEIGPGNGAGDGLQDRVTINGTAGNDAIVVTGSAGSVNVTGLAATVAIAHADAGSDRVDIVTLAGSDTVDTTGLAPAVIQLFVDGIPV